jgi:hypothetical protein
MWWMWLVVTVLYVALFIYSCLRFYKQTKELKAMHEETKKILFSAKDTWKMLIADEQLFKEFLSWKIIHGHIADEHVRTDH